MLFALVAGAGTALSPCVLPVLPAVVAGGVTGGRRRPLGLAIGLALSFTFATVVLAYAIDALGLPNDFVRTLAIVVLLVFGLSLLVPRFGDRIEAWLSRIGASPRSLDGDGFGSGLLVGASLGLVYAPCAGPILAGVITVSATQDFTIDKLLVALAYGIGSGITVYLLLVGGRRLADRLRGARGRVQPALGVVMILVAVMLIADLDIKFETALANHAPGFLVNPTKSIEDSGAAKRRLADLRGGHATQAAGESQAAAGSRLPVLGKAPPLVGNQQWFNSRPLTIAGLRGRVVLIDFWTYTCINCLRTLPYVKAWDARYRGKGLTVIGVHTPEFPFEKEASNVRKAIASNGIRYPVVQDNNYATWTAYGNQFWPAKYLIDAEGRVRYVHFGEGEYGTTEKAIRSLLAEAGAGGLGGDARVSAQGPAPGVTTPETYLGALRALRYANGSITPGVHDYRLPGAIPRDHFGYGGRWRVTNESATALGGARLDTHFNARRVYLVMGARGRKRLTVYLDGRPIPAKLAGDDVKDGVATISGQRLYRLVNLPRTESHRLDLRFQPGITGYAFTFG